MSTLTVTVTRCPCGTSTSRPITEPCPAPGCGRMVPGQQHQRVLVVVDDPPPQALHFSSAVIWERLTGVSDVD